jgi:hypothetical protein
VKAEMARPVAKKLAWITSRAKPAIREIAVASAKMVVLRASRRRGGEGGADAGDSPVVVVSADTRAL